MLRHRVDVPAGTKWSFHIPRTHPVDMAVSIGGRPLWLVRLQSAEIDSEQSQLWAPVAYRGCELRVERTRVSLPDHLDHPEQVWVAIHPMWMIFSSPCNCPCHAHPATGT